MIDTVFYSLLSACLSALSTLILCQLTATLNALLINELSISILCALLYFGTTAYIKLKVTSNTIGVSRPLSLWLMVPAALHCWAIYLGVDTPAGQNLAFFNVVSLTAWLLIVLLLLRNLQRAALPLYLYGLPLAGLAVLAAALDPSADLMQLESSPLSLAHIWLAILAHSLLAAAALQAGLILLLDRRLRSNPGEINPLTPSLQQMEHFLFLLLWFGMLLLTIALILGFGFIPEPIASQPLHKILLSSLAWVIFLVLLIGHHLYGWRGRRAARMTILGFALLLLGYFGSKLVLEFILQR